MDICAFCDSPLGHEEEVDLVPAAVGTPDEPEWRTEVTRKLDAYRRRRHNSSDEESQTPLPFSEPPRPSPPIARRAPVAETPRPPALRNRPPAPERVEISVTQPSLDFTLPAQRVHPETHLAPPAAIRERTIAGLLDFLFIGVVYGGFLIFFQAIGGRLSMTKLDAGVFTALFFLMYTSYFSLFTIFGGATPGMLFGNLVAVRIDGTPPDTGPLVWRSFGYLLSGGTLFIGFFWALWDEDGLTWHDRISQTYITNALSAEEPTGIVPSRPQHSMAGK